MKISAFETNQLDELMEFLDENLNENYEKNVFLNIRKRWPEGFLIVKDREKIVGACCGAILPNEKLRILILVLQRNYQKQIHLQEGCYHQQEDYQRIPTQLFLSTWT